MWWWGSAFLLRQKNSPAGNADGDAEGPVHWRHGLGVTALLAPGARRKARSIHRPLPPRYRIAGAAIRLSAGSGAGPACGDRGPGVASAKKKARCGKIGFHRPICSSAKFMQAQAGSLCGQGSRHDSGDELQWFDGGRQILGRGRPPFAGEDVRFEVHLFDFDGRSLRGSIYWVALLAYIPGPEMKFSGLDSWRSRGCSQIATRLSAHARRIYRGPGRFVNPSAAARPPLDR